MRTHCAVRKWGADSITDTGTAQQLKTRSHKFRENQKLYKKGMFIYYLWLGYEKYIVHSQKYVNTFNLTKTCKKVKFIARVWEGRFVSNTITHNV